MMNFRQEILDLVFASARTLGEIHADPFIREVSTLHETSDVLAEMTAEGKLVRVGGAYYSTERDAVSAPLASA